MRGAGYGRRQWREFGVGVVGVCQLAIPCLGRHQQHVVRVNASNVASPSPSTHLRHHQRQRCDCALSTLLCSSSAACPPPPAHIHTTLIFLVRAPPPLSRHPSPPQPDFIEIKGVTYCGDGAASTLTMANVPYHADVVAFGQAICEARGGGAGGGGVASVSPADRSPQCGLAHLPTCPPACIKPDLPDKSGRQWSAPSPSRPLQQMPPPPPPHTHTTPPTHRPPFPCCGGAQASTGLPASTRTAAASCWRAPTASWWAGRGTPGSTTTVSRSSSRQVGGRGAGRGGCGVCGSKKHVYCTALP